ncbi:unnamed protein product [Nippostrongylus brasiliensis]|uniref:Peptidase A2 domain-containing protein n=1 Tax=Nippostrongylus brasiliensis TaxID=27835 RepID=A0A0N4Y3P0_NIPBR|nr:unnamed protein product [Nippostrongylus brasiliensis]
MTAEGNVWNYNKGEYEKILFFFDTGAQKTVIEESLAAQLGAPKQTTELCTMSGIGGHTETFESHIINLQVCTAYGEELEMEVQTKPVITNGFPGVNLSSADVAFLKANSICLANSKIRGEQQKPHILVGLDHYHDLVTGPINAIKTPTGLHIAKTVFGPTIYGKGTVSGENTSTISYGMTAVCESDEKEILQKMFELEGLGISQDEYQSDEKVYRYLEQYSKKISFEGGHITAPVITNGFPGVNLSSADVAFLKANSICLANSKIRGEQQKPHILVGLDHYHDLVTGPINAIKTPTGLHIAKTVFGRTIYGKGTVSGENTSTISYGMTAVCESDEKEILQKMFELEGLGISQDEYQSDEKVYRYLEQYSKKISFEGGHITAPFPLKDNITELEDNYIVAIRRLESLQMTLKHNSEQRHWYGKIIDKYQNEGMIETFAHSDEGAVGEYYMPHAGVWRPTLDVINAAEYQTESSVPRRLCFIKGTRYLRQDDLQ